MSVPYMDIGGLEIMNGNPGANYQLNQNGYVPSIPGLEDSQIGGAGIYTEVVEELDLRISDTTPAACYTRLDALNRVLYEAKKSVKNEDATPVYFSYAPGQSAVSTSTTPLKALILGPAPGDQTSGVRLTAEWNETTFTYEIRHVLVRFWRRIFLCDTQTATSSATTNGDVVSLAFGAATDNPSPTNISLSKVVLQAISGYLIVSDEQKIDVIAAEGAAAGVYTSIADAGKLPRNTNILRYTPGVATEVASAAITVTPSTGVQLTSGLFAIFANIRNNSNTVSYLQRMKLIGTTTTYTEPFVINPYVSAAYPEWKLVGLAYAKQLLSVTFLLTASATGSTVDFDSIVILNLSRSHSQVIRTTLLDSGSAAYLSGGGALFVEHNLNPASAFQYPIVGSLSGSDSYPHTPDGDPVIFTKSSTIYSLFLATAADNNLDRWRQENSAAAGTALTNVWGATRAIAYPTPK